MKCQHCGGPTHVSETREVQFATPSVKRRRQCTQCDERVTTYEISEAEWRAFKGLPRKETADKTTKVKPASNNLLSNAIGFWGPSSPQT